MMENVTTRRIGEAAGRAMSRVRTAAIMGLPTLALGGFMLAGAGTAAAAECGYNSFSQTWKNCSNEGDYVAVVAYDGVTQRTFNQYVCVPAGKEWILMPTYVVYSATKAGTC